MVILGLVLYGLLRGIVRLVLGFAGLGLGWVLAVRYCEPLAIRFGAATPSTAGPDLRRITAFILIFGAVGLAMSLMAWLITRALGAVKLNGANRAAGAGLGLLLAIVLVCAATVPLIGMWPPDGGMSTDRSVLAPYAVAGGEYFVMLVPEPLRARFNSGAKRVFGASARKPEPAPRPR